MGSGLVFSGCESRQDEGQNETRPNFFIVQERFMMKLQESLEILETVAKSFPRESREHEAVETACHALLFVEGDKVRTRYEHFIKRKDGPLNGLELISLRVYGIDIPDKERTPEVMELASEIDAIAAKLRGK